MKSLPAKIKAMQYLFFASANVVEFSAKLYKEILL